MIVARNGQIVGNSEGEPSIQMAWFGTIDSAGHVFKSAVDLRQCATKTPTDGTAQPALSPGVYQLVAIVPDLYHGSVGTVVSAPVDIRIT